MKLNLFNFWKIAGMTIRLFMVYAAAGFCLIINNVAAEDNIILHTSQKGVWHGKTNPLIVEKLIPAARDISAIQLPPISVKRLHNLILNPALMSEESFILLPIIVAGNNPGASLYTVGDTVYVKGLVGYQVGERVSIVSRFRLLTDPDSKESLGYEIRYNGDAVINQMGPISSLEITHAINQIQVQDRIAPVFSRNLPQIVPHKSAQIITGKIVALYDTFSSVGLGFAVPSGAALTAEDSTVIINRGSRDGVDIGQIFDITNTQHIMEFTANPNRSKYLVIPPSIIGEILIYKVYAKVSFGLITDSTTAVLLNDIVQSER